MNGLPMLTYAQMAAMVGNSVSTVERWVHDGHIPYHRTGRNIRFDPAEIRAWLEENEITGDNRIQPVRPLGRYGVQHVYPSQTLGDLDHCWCGDLVDHEWEGKAKGAPHPHEHERMQQVVVVERESEPNRARIEKTDLRGFHATLKSFIIQCVNHDRLPWRSIGSNSILLYPPDDTSPVTVYCRNNDNQMRTLRQWYAAHVEPHKKVEKADVEALAVAVNDPVEHPVEPGFGTIGDQIIEGMTKAVSNADQWQPYLNSDGEHSQFFESDGDTIRCRECVGTDTAYETPVEKVRGLGGHIRMTHRETESLRTPEALAKSIDSRRYNRLHEKVTVAVELLAETLGMDVSPTRMTELQNEITRLQHALEKETKRADDALTRLSLMQEAFRGLE